MTISWKAVLIVAVVAGMFGYSKGFERGYGKGMQHKQQLIPRPADKWPLIPFLQNQLEPIPDNAKSNDMESTTSAQPTI